MKQHQPITSLPSSLVPLSNLFHPLPSSQEVDPKFQVPQSLKSLLLFSSLTHNTIHSISLISELFISVSNSPFTQKIENPIILSFISSSDSSDTTISSSRFLSQPINHHLSSFSLSHTHPVSSSLIYSNNRNELRFCNFVNFNFVN